jgi:AcrR family transcriptional regulator
MQIMVETLRERQKRVAREAILQAAAEEIVTHGIADFSLQAVAAQAGLSVRTLYNYFDSRDTLLLALVDWSNQLTVEQGGWLAIHNLDGLPEATARVWQAWEQQGVVFQAVQMIDAAGATEVRDTLRTSRRGRTEQLMAILAERRPDLAPDEVEEIAALLHTLLGQTVWRRMRELSGLSSDRSGPVITWALRLIVDALDRGDHPRDDQLRGGAPPGAVSAPAPPASTR